MNVTKAELTRSWLVKAQRDLLSAKHLSEAREPLLDTAAYHCQQAAEKAIKAFLLYHDVRFGKTHDLEVLLAQAAEINPSFTTCRDEGRILTPLAVEFRYPGEYIEPEREEFEEAYLSAGRIYDFVLDHLDRIVVKGCER
ncbi:MAG: HEPN domain-containing protein [Desulfuromonadales bacterium]|nr:HEPN domain-containing protein [Desulfuromonadales bacterium]